MVGANKACLQKSGAEEDTQEGIFLCHCLLYCRHALFLDRWDLLHKIIAIIVPAVCFVYAVLNLLRAIAETQLKIKWGLLSPPAPFFTEITILTIAIEAS